MILYIARQRMCTQGIDGLARCQSDAPGMPKRAAGLRLAGPCVQAYRNTVPVPRHWSQKRKYLQGKRGLEKPPFKLPDFIEATGIGEMRQAYQEKVTEPPSAAYNSAP